MILKNNNCMDEPINTNLSGFTGFVIGLGSGLNYFAKVKPTNKIIIKIFGIEMGIILLYIITTQLKLIPHIHKLRSFMGNIILGHILSVSFNMICE